MGFFLWLILLELYINIYWLHMLNAFVKYSIVFVCHNFWSLVPLWSANASLPVCFPGIASLSQMDHKLSFFIVFIFQLVVFFFIWDLSSWQYIILMYLNWFSFFAFALFHICKIISFQVINVSICFLFLLPRTWLRLRENFWFIYIVVKNALRIRQHTVD